MADVHAKNEANDLWWVGVAMGVVSLFFGIATLFWPGLTLVTFVYLFSAFILVWGVVSIIKSLMSIGGANGAWWLSLIFGILALALGVYLVRHPGVSFATVILYTGFAFIVRGIFDVVEGIFGQDKGGTKALAIIVGVLGVLAGIMLLSQPVSAGIAFVWVIGLYSLIAGPILIVLATKERPRPRPPVVTA